MPDYRQSGSPETGLQELETFFWQARVARDVLNAATADPDERAKATWRWALLYRLVYSTQNETTRAELESLAAKEGIAPLSHYLREFALDIANAILTDPDPVKKLDSILHGQPKRGQPKRSFRESIEIAVGVEQLRRADTPLTKAYEAVANTLGKTENFTSNAVRMIYGRVMKDSADASCQAR
jgi:hypothetical protein